MPKFKVSFELFTLSGIIVIAAIIRLIALFNFGTYTFDDIFSVHFASLNLGQMFSLLQNEVHPPAYYLLLHFWIKFFGDNEIVTKLPSLFFSLGTMIVIYYLTKKILNRFSATLATIIFALSYFQIFSACQARMYPMLEFGGALSLLLFWQIFVEKKKGLWLLYILTNSVMLLTHLGSLFALATQGLWFLILVWQKQIDKPKAKKFFLAQIPGVTLWLAWLVALFLPKLPTIINQGWYFSSTRNRNFAVGIYDYFFLLLKSYWLRFYSAVIILAAPFMILLWPESKKNRQTPKQINPNWFLFAWLLPGLIVSAITQINYIRIFSISYLALYLIVAYFFYLLWLKQKKLFWFLITAWFLISLFTLSQNLFLQFCRWDLGNQWLAQNEKPKDKIIISSYIYELPFQRYYTGKNNFVGFYPINDNKTLDQRISEKNWQNLINTNNVGELQALIEGFDRVIIIFEVNSDDHYFSAPVHQWLTNNGWQIETSYKPDSFCGPQIIVYYK
ncbi:MAG: glycosyltransferase family 39 protein [Patescibacteria group bacterium]